MSHYLKKMIYLISSESCLEVEPLNRCVRCIYSKVSDDEWKVKFVSRIENGKIKWPNNENISNIGEEKVEKLLLVPNFHLQNNKISCFSFKEGFMRYKVE